MMSKFLSLLSTGALVVVAAPAALADSGEEPRRFDKVAEHFNISTEELQAELDSGKTLRDVAIEHGMTQEDAKKIRQKKMKNHRKHVLKEQISETLGMTKEDLFHSFRLPVQLHFISQATGESVDTLRDKKAEGTLGEYLISLGFDIEDLKDQAAEARANR